MKIIEMGEAYTRVRKTRSTSNVWSEVLNGKDVNVRVFPKVPGLCR
jgi:hypothetical protein